MPASRTLSSPVHEFGDERDQYHSNAASRFQAFAPNDPGGVQGLLTPTSGAAPNGLTYFNWDQGAAQIDRAGASWVNTLATPVTITYAFRQTGTPPSSANVSVFQQFNAQQIQAAEEALRFWSEVTNITFVRVGAGTSGPGAYSNSATILFGNFMNGPPQFSAFAYLPDPAFMAAGDAEGDVWVNGSRDYDADPITLPLGARILLHEIGHAIGLLHPSDYGGGAQSGPVYDVDADFWQDTQQFTAMSYFNETFTGAFFGGATSLTPMMFDIAAAQRLYGVNTATRTGDTVYGFNSNAGHAAYAFVSPFAFGAFCIWDGGGNDTLDLSNYSSNSQIDLREESFSSAGRNGNGDALISNISIARGAVIENAIGGSGADTIIGNAVANTLRGNAGADIMTGGAGIDTSVYAGASTAATWTRTVAGAWIVTAGADGTDTLTGVERLDFTDRDVVLDNAQQSFLGNGTSDIMFRNLGDGQIATWDVTGATQNSAAIAGAVGAEWVIQGTGDFSGDGRDDILLRNTNTGMVVAWRNANWTQADFIGAAPSQWQIEGVGDFNFDGRDDFLWRNQNDGTIVTWLMNGGSVTSQHVISGAPIAWDIAAIADFNGDGRDDIMLRHTDGTLAMWTTNGTAQTSAVIVSAAPTMWRLDGAGDFDGDGRADLLWRNTVDGGAAVWRMDGATQLGAAMIGAAPLAWQIEDVGDYNGDGRDDILWRNSDGTLALWTMNGFTVTNTQIVGFVPPVWDLV